MAKRLTIETHRFGRIEVAEEELLEFEEILGFPYARRFLVRQHDRGSVFAWLISADVPDLAFVIANPWHFFPDYAPEISTQHLKTLHAKAPEEVEIVSLVTVGDQALSFNLAGPILINPSARKGMQVILDGKDYPASASVALPRPGASAEETAASPSPRATRG